MAEMLANSRGGFRVFDGLPDLKIKSREHAFDGEGFVKKVTQNRATRVAAAGNRRGLIEMSVEGVVRVT